MRPWCIAHRGASDHAHDNSRESFERAVQLGADWFEVDVRTTADDHLVAWHDPTTRKLGGEARRVDSLTLHELQADAARAGRVILLFDEVLELAARHGIGIYADAKDANAVSRCADHLSAAGIGKGVIASYNVQSLAQLGQRACAYPRSILVPPGRKPIELAQRADASIVHLTWANAREEQQARLDDALLAELRGAGLDVVLWHQEDPAIIEHWLTLPVLGICSNRPELLNSYRHQLPEWKPAIMCEGGLGFVAPPHTLPTATVAFDAGYDYIRVRTGITADGQAVTLDDAGASDLIGHDCAVSDLTLDALNEFDPGACFDSWFTGTPVARFDDMLALARSRGRGLAIEVNAGSLPTLMASVSRQGAMATCLFWSDDPACLLQVRACSAEARIIGQRRRYASLDDALMACSAQVIEFDATGDDLTEVSDCAARGAISLVRYSGSDREVFRRLLTVKPAIVNLERPDLFRELL